MLAYLLLFFLKVKKAAAPAPIAEIPASAAQRGILVVSPGLGDIRNRLELVMELGNDRLSLVNGYGDICGKPILFVGFVGHLGDHIISDARPSM